MNLKESKKTKRNIITLFGEPKRCNRCEHDLVDRSALMMGVSWECFKCDRRWSGDDMREII